MERIKLAAGDLRLELAPAVGGSITAFFIERSEGVIPLMRPAPEEFDDPLDGACFALVPFVNRVRDGTFTCDGRTVSLAPNLPGQRHPLHGDGWRAPWSLEAAGPLSAEIVHRHPAGAWPWAYEARQRFDLDADGLWLRLSCRNLSDARMPCGLGLHPYFPCDPTTVLGARVEGVWTIDDEIMPVSRVAADGRFALGERRICGADLDNGFDGWSGEALITWPERGVSLTFTAPAASRLQVYAPAEGGLFVAEPVTHDNAALNRGQTEWSAAGLVMLGPDQEMALTTRFEIRRSIDTQSPP